MKIISTDITKSNYFLVFYIYWEKTICCINS